MFSQIQKWIPSDFGAYLEPFLGGGAVFFHLLPQEAALSDLNEELMNVYWAVQNEVETLMNQLDRHDQRKMEKEYYYETRGTNPDDLDRVARAARTIFLNKTC